MNKTAYIIAGFITLVLAGGLYYFFRDEPPKPVTPAAQTEKQTAPNLTFAGTSIVEEKNGKRVWELGAETIEADARGKLVYLRNLKGTFYQDKGGKLELLAKQAVLDTKTGEISLQGEIKATASDGSTFTAPEVKYNNDTKTLIGSGGVTLTRGDTVITGDKLNADTNMEKVKVQGHAKVVTGGKN